MSTMPRRAAVEGWKHVTRFITTAPGFSVAGQLAPADIEAAAEAGYRVVVNNRPDGEEPGQPPGAEIEAAAKAAGLAYRAIPVSGAPTMAAVDEMAEMLAGADGPVIAYCRSGRRSMALWALAQAKARADPPDEIIRLAEAAGYDLSALRATLDQLSRG